MIHGDLASNLIPVSLLILACVTILRCASSNSIWLRLRPTNDLPLITPLLLPCWYSSKCLSHQTHQPHMTPDNCSRELESLGAPSEKQEALKGEGQGRQKDKIYAYLCAVRSGMLTIVCVCVCVFGYLVEVSVLSEPSCTSQVSGQTLKLLRSTCHCSCLVSLTCPQWHHRQGTLSISLTSLFSARLK